MPRRLLAVVPFVGLVTIPACSKDPIEGPKAEVKPHGLKLDMPAVPPFDLPPASSDGSHSVKEMRVKGKKFLDQTVTIKGYITWAYDCAAALRTENMSDKDVQKIIDEDPTKCERPKFYIGDATDTPPEKSVWVVDVPRPPNKLEIERLPKEEIKAWLPVPPYKVGDEVIVTGDWRLASPHSERNSDGLLVHKSLKNVTQNWETPPLTPEQQMRYGGGPVMSGSGTPPAGSPTTPPPGGTPGNPTGPQTKEAPKH
jgi:hypothetical protein